jgi:hypothetical protein
MTRKHSPLFVTKDLLETRYKGAEVIFVAGSVMRGEATEHSDLDLVVVYPKIEQAFRESFYHLEWPIEAFVHDPKTLKQFFYDIDQPTGTSTLAEMVYDGLETPTASAFSDELKKMAGDVLQTGPPALTPAEIEDRRYHLSERLDDLRMPRSKIELFATASFFFGEIADYYFRINRQYSATGKAILKKLKKSDPAFYRRFTEAFDQLFSTGQSKLVIELTEELLAPHGGLLFDQYRREAATTDGLLRRTDR